MEAMIIGYPPEQAGQISVTATKEEWSAVIAAVSSSYAESDTSERLVNWLINQGVYE
jgi:hypothetical protein